MKKNELAFVWRAAAFGLALLSMAVPTTRTAAQGLPLCSWPFEVTGRGITNVATPDTNATYWVMPVDTNRWSLVIIDGEYPAARFFNFSSYQATGALVDSIEDASIPPNSGVNPFAIKIEDHPFGSYEIQASRSAGGSGTSLRLGGSRLQFIVYRVYAPDMGVDRAGGVGVPRVTLVAPNGTSRTLQPCPFADAETSLTGLILLLRANGFTDAANFLQRVLMAADQLRFGRDSCAGQPTPTTVNFDIATLGADFFPNPQTTYLETPGLCLPTGKVLVVKGRAPIFPSTYNGGSIFDPAPPFDPGSEIQLRYWSMCNNNRVIPFPVIACQADFATIIERTSDQGSAQPIYTYTYIVSADPAPPSWLPADATWLPWSATDIPKNLIFRALVPENSFELTKDYYPHGVFCDPAMLQACLAAANAQM